MLRRRYRVDLFWGVAFAICLMVTDRPVHAASVSALANSADAFAANGFDENDFLDFPETDPSEFEPVDPIGEGNPFDAPLADEGDCDITGDGVCNCDDIDELTELLAGGANGDELDLDGSGIVDFADRDHLIVELMQSTYGDANQDGKFGPNDFVLVFSHGYYDDPDPGRPVSFCEGDWNGDGVFDSSDLVLAFEESVYTPEPSSGLLFLIGLIAFRRRR